MSKIVCAIHGELDEAVFQVLRTITWNKDKEEYDGYQDEPGTEWQYLCPKCIEEGKDIEDCVVDGGRN